MRRGPAVVVFLALIAVVALQVTIHWLLGQGTFPTFLAVYLSGGSSGKHFVAGVVDNSFPAAVLGFVAGWAGYPRWSPRRVFLVVVLLSCLVAGLVPIYRGLLAPHNHSVHFPGKVSERPICPRFP
jgi:hypothetical protein